MELDRLDVLHFFERQQQTAALPIYEALERAILAEIPNVRIKVQKTQISFYNRHLFACASFLRVRRKKELPPCYLVVTFGLARRVESPRIAAAVEAYPGRWTHHLIAGSPAEIDAGLMAWVKEAAAFADAK